MTDDLQRLSSSLKKVKCGKYLMLPLFCVKFLKVFVWLTPIPNLVEVIHLHQIKNEHSAKASQHVAVYLHPRGGTPTVPCWFDGYSDIQIKLYSEKFVSLLLSCDSRNLQSHRTNLKTKKQTPKAVFLWVRLIFVFTFKNKTKHFKSQVQNCPCRASDCIYENKVHKISEKNSTLISEAAVYEFTSVSK